MVWLNDILPMYSSIAIIVCIIPAYTSALMSALTIPYKSKPLDTFEQLAKTTSHQVLVNAGTRVEFMFHRSSDPLFQSIARKIDAQGNKYEDKNLNYRSAIYDPNVVIFRDELSARIRKDLFYSNIETGQKNVQL